MVRGQHPTRPAVRFPDWVDDLAFSPTDGTLAVLDNEGGLYLHDPDADQSIRINSNDAGELHETDLFRHLAFSADGRKLAVRGGRLIWLWDMQTRQLRRTIKTGRALAGEFAFHPNGKLLAAADAGATSVVTFWDTSTGQKANSYDWDIGKEILSLAFAADGMTAAAGSNSGKIVLWDLDV
jgi:WD40 repeat protein